METAELGKIVKIIEGQEVEEDRKTKKKDDMKKDDVWIMKKTFPPRLAMLISVRVQGLDFFMTR